MTELGLTLIKFGDRRREDYGDIDALAKSIAEHGLLHPIVVDADDNLVAGGRRLRAVEQLGWLSIRVTRLDDLTETQMREIELEENLRRKDLTAEERSRNLVALADTGAEVIRSTTERKSTGGRPSEPDSLRSVADRINVSPQTVMRAKDHVAALDRYPELRAAAAIGASQKDVVTIAKNLDALPDEERAETLRKVEARDIDTIGDLAEKPPMPDGWEQQNKGVARSWKWGQAVLKALSLVRGFREHGAAELVASWEPGERAEFERDLNRMIAQLEAIRDETREVIKRAA